MDPKKTLSSRTGKIVIDAEELELLQTGQLKLALLLAFLWGGINGKCKPGGGGGKNWFF